MLGLRVSAATAPWVRRWACRWACLKCGASTRRRQGPRVTWRWSLRSSSTRRTASAVTYRDPSAEVPTLAAVAEQRRLRRRRGQRRHGRRPTRGLGAIASAVSAAACFWPGRVTSSGISAEALDRIDRAEPRTGPPASEEDRAARQVLDAARGAPELFRPVLVDSLLELAADTTDATAFEALTVLVRSGHCPPRRALDSARPFCGVSGPLRRAICWRSWNPTCGPRT